VNSLKSAVLDFLSSDKTFLPFLFLCLFVPLFLRGSHFGAPRVKGGDEPHYLVMINSLLKDGDLDLRNNYDSALKGSSQAGSTFAGFPLDRHTTWMEKGQKVRWPDLYEVKGEKWGKDLDGFFTPTLKPGVQPPDGTRVEYSLHPFGSPILIASLLWPFRVTSHVESAALILSNFIFFLSALAFRRILRRYVSDPGTVNLTVFLVFLGTPLWHYGRTLFTESLLLTLAVGAVALVLEKKTGFWPGVLIGLGMLMKPVFLLLAVPLFWFLAREGKFKAVLRMIVAPLLAGGTILAMNNFQFGSPWQPSMTFRFGNPLAGATGLWFSWNHGIVAFAPVVLLALAAWGKFLREKKREAVLIGSSFAVYFLLFSLWHIWDGGWCFGPRLIVPVLPFLMTPLFYLPGLFQGWGRWRRALCVGLCLLSLGVNFCGALNGSWGSHPLTLLWTRLGFL
jgi:hypothetical protein